MAIAFRTASATAKAASGNLGPISLPLGHAADDILILYVEAQDNVVCSVSGWTNVAAATGNDGANRRAEVWVKRDNGAEPAVTVTHTAGGIINAIIEAYSGVDPGLTLTVGAGGVFRDVQKQTGTSTTTVTAPALSGVVSGDYRIFFGAFTVNDTSGAGTNNWGTVSTFTERKDDCSSLAGAWAVSFGLDNVLASGSAGSITSAVGWTGAFGATWGWIGTQLALSSDASATSGPYSQPQPLLMRLRQFNPVGVPIFGFPWPPAITTTPLVTITPNALTHARATPAPQVNPTVVPAALTHTRVVYAPNASPRIFPVALSHARSVFAPDLDTVLKPAALTHTRATPAPQINVRIFPAALSHTRTVYSPTALGSFTLLPATLAHTRATPAPTVSPQVRPGALTHSRTVYSPSLLSALKLAALTHTRAIFTPNVVHVIVPAMLAHTRAVPAPKINVRFSVPMLSHTRAVYEPFIPGLPSGVLEQQGHGFLE